MGRYYHQCFSLTSFNILILFLFIHRNTAASSDGAHGPCAKVDCGQGSCVNSSVSLLGFDCSCNPGWTKVQLGLITFPACTIPNCTINYQCGNSAPPPLPPPATSDPPAFNILNPCNLVWCGDGTCVANGLGYSCKCKEGSANLFNMTGVACFKECSLGADCKGVSFGSPASSSPPATSGNAFGSPATAGNALGSPANSPAPPRNASRSQPNCSTDRGHVMIMLAMCLIFLSLI